MAAFPFELVSPERLLFTGEVESVVVPGSEGELTVLKDHAPLMTTLKPGIVTVNEASGKSQRLFVRGGFADVAPTGLTILAESSVPIEQLDGVRLDAEIKGAQDEVERVRQRRGPPPRHREAEPAAGVARRPHGLIIAQATV